MQRIIRMVPAVVCAMMVTACGGGGSTERSVVPQGTQTAQQAPNSQVRRPKSGGSCTLDSYGYCSYLFQSHRGGSGNCINGSQTYQVYGPGYADEGYFLHSWTYCNGDYNDDWSPSEPSVTFGDPNLP